MTQAAKLRDALPAGTELNREGMLDATGIPTRKLDGVLHAFIARGELLVREKGDEKLYRIDPDYVRGGKKKAAKKKVAKKAAKTGRKGKGKGKPGRKAKRPFKALAEKYARRDTDREELRQLALENYLMASKQLREAVTTDVEGIPEGGVLHTALGNHDRAEKLFTSTQSA